MKFNHQHQYCQYKQEQQSYRLPRGAFIRRQVIHPPWAIHTNFTLRPWILASSVNSEAIPIYGTKGGYALTSTCRLFEHAVGAAFGGGGARGVSGRRGPLTLSLASQEG